jgi:hypothetical protein
VPNECQRRTLTRVVVSEQRPPTLGIGEHGSHDAGVRIEHGENLRDKRSNLGEGSGPSQWENLVVQPHDHRAE